VGEDRKGRRREGNLKGRKATGSTLKKSPCGKVCWNLKERKKNSGGSEGRICRAVSEVQLGLVRWGGMETYQLSFSKGRVKGKRTERQGSRIGELPLGERNHVERRNTLLKTK